MKDPIISNFGAELMPLYQQLEEEVSAIIKGGNYKFVAQWGRHYPYNNNQGLLFVGRATNTWQYINTVIDDMFGPPDNDVTLFNRDDQMNWVYRDWQSHAHRSAFWRVILGVARKYYPIDQALEYVAWSNICKIQAANGKNPYGHLFDKQIGICNSISAVELKYLSPRFVILFTGGYGEREFLSFLSGGYMPNPLETYTWCGFPIDVYEINGILFLCTEHPMRKPESPHIECLSTIINKYW